MNKNLCIRRAIKWNRFGTERDSRIGPNPSAGRDPDKARIVVWVSGTVAHRRRILSRESADWSGIVVELLLRNLFHLHIRMSKHAHVERLYHSAATAAAALFLSGQRNRLYDITLPVEARDIRFIRSLHLLRPVFYRALLRICHLSTLLLSIFFYENRNFHGSYRKRRHRLLQTSQMP